MCLSQLERKKSLGNTYSKINTGKDMEKKRILNVSIKSKNKAEQEKM